MSDQDLEFEKNLNKRQQELLNVLTEDEIAEAKSYQTLISNLFEHTTALYSVVSGLFNPMCNVDPVILYSLSTYVVHLNENYPLDEETEFSQVLALCKEYIQSFEQAAANQQRDYDEAVNDVNGIFGAPKAEA